jgi:hypothetical protein
MISHFHETVFIHVPKNAGQSIEQAFLSDIGLSWRNRAPLLLRPRVDCDNDTPPRLAHLTGSQYVSLKYITPKMFSSYYKFGVCRNPWDRAFSLFKYLTNQSKPFTRFVKEDFKKEIYEKHQWFAMSQAKFLLDESNKPLVDKIIRFEKLKDGFEEVARKLRFKTTDLPHINTSKSQVKIDYREAYCEESKQIIADMYADDIELFNYSFG